MGRKVLPVFYEQSLSWWFRCIRLQGCVGPVRVRGTALMYHGRPRECARLDSTTRRAPSGYASLGGGGLRPSRTSSGSTGSVRIYIRTHERYTPIT